MLEYYYVEEELIELLKRIEEFNGINKRARARIKNSNREVS